MANHPLTEQDYEAIVTGLKDLDEADRQADLAMRAGIDLADSKKQIADTRAKLMKLRQVYFPGR